MMAMFDFTFSCSPTSSTALGFTQEDGATVGNRYKKT